MGIVSKMQTKARTGATVVPNAFAQQASEFEAAMCVDSVVRSCAMSIGQLGLVSSTRRGSTSTLVNLIDARESTSAVWVTRSGSRSWSVAIGVDSTTGRMLDWSVKIHIATDETDAPVVVIQTEQMLTLDGALVNGKAHDELRTNIAYGVTNAIVPSLADECRASEVGFTRDIGVFLRATETVRDTVSISTVLKPDEVRSALALVQLATISRSADQIVFALGLRTAESAHVTVDMEDQGTARVVRCTTAVDVSTPSIASAVALKMADRVSTEIHGTIRLFDPESTLIPTGGKD